jgi:hypothetical protein
VAGSILGVLLRIGLIDLRRTVVAVVAVLFLLLLILLGDSPVKLPERGRGLFGVKELREAEEEEEVPCESIEEGRRVGEVAVVAADELLFLFSSGLIVVVVVCDDEEAEEEE